MTAEMRHGGVIPASPEERAIILSTWQTRFSTLVLQQGFPSVEQFCYQKLGLHPSTVSRWLNGKESLGNQRLVRLGASLGIDSRLIVTAHEEFAVYPEQFGEVEQNGREEEIV